MVTIKDIAKKAGVSHGTVSNVLNNKGNVSVNKIKQVNEAIKELGYVSNESAKLLRKGKNNVISIIVPNMIDREYCQFVNAIRNKIDEKKSRLQIHTTFNNRDKEIEILNYLSTELISTIISITCLEEASYYEDIFSQDVELIFVDRQPNDARNYFGFNQEQAIVDLSEEIKKIGIGSIAAVLDDGFHPFESEILGGLVGVGAIANKDIFKYPFYSLHKKIFSLAKSNDYTTFLTTNSKVTNIIKSSYAFLENNNFQILSISGDDSLINNKNHLNYYLNYFELGTLVAESLNELKKENQKIINCSGFIQSRLALKHFETETKISLLSVPNPTVDAVDKLKVFFERNTNVEVNIVKSPSISFEQKLVYNSDEFDLLRLDVAQFPMESKRLLLPLNGLTSTLDDKIEKLKKNGYGKFMEADGVVYGLPLDPSYQLLFYRKDIFEDSIVQRLYYEATKKELKVPETWEEYYSVANFFNDHSIEKKLVDSGITMNLYNESIIATDFFGVYYSLGGNIEFNANIVQLNKRIAVKAVNIYLDLMQSSLKVTDSWWTSIINNYVEGKTAMVLGYMNHLSNIASEEIISRTHHSIPPGDKPLLGGGVIGINKSSENIDVAIEFITWLLDEHTSREITRLGGTTSSIEINRLEEFSQVYPWLYNSNESILKGIRENVTSQGIPVNLRLIENIVGSILKKNINKGAEKIVDEINDLLKINY